MGISLDDTMDYTPGIHIGVRDSGNKIKNNRLFYNPKYLNLEMRIW